MKAQFRMKSLAGACFIVAMLSLAVRSGAQTPSAFTPGTGISSSAVNSMFGSKVDANNGALTGAPTAPTAAAGTNTTQLATTAFVRAAAAAISSSLAAVATSGSYGDLSGKPVIPTIGTVAGTARDAAAAIAAESAAQSLAAAALPTATAATTYATKASPAFTGTPTAPTAAAGANSTQIATAAYADGAVGVEKARAQAAESLALPSGGGTATGPIILNADPTTALGAVTKQYVDAGTAVRITAEGLLLPKASPAWSGTMTGQGSLELGITTSGAGGSTFLDFHSDGSTTDYNARIITTGGTAGVTGSGALAIDAGTIALNGTTTSSTAAPGTNSTRIATTGYADAAVAVEKARAMAAEGWGP